LKDPVFALAVESRVIRSFVVEQSAFGAFAVAGRFVAPFGIVCKEVTPFTLLYRFGFARDAQGDLFAKKEVPGFDNLLDFVPGVVV